MDNLQSRVSRAEDSIEIPALLAIQEAAEQESERNGILATQLVSRVLYVIPKVEELRWSRRSLRRRVCAGAIH